MEELKQNAQKVYVIYFCHKAVMHFGSKQPLKSFVKVSGGIDVDAVTT